MNIWIIAGEITFALLILFFAWFSFVCIHEKEKKAFVRSKLSLILFLSLNILFFVVTPPLRTYLFAFTAIFSSFFFLWLFISPVPKKSIEIVGDQNKIDERDVIFARFDFQEGTQVFKDYYASHPEFESVDSQIRKMPDLFDPSHNKKNPRFVGSLIDTTISNEIYGEG